jgi:hypothetical protein
MLEYTKQSQFQHVWNVFRKEHMSVTIYLEHVVFKNNRSAFLEMTGM